MTSRPPLDQQEGPSPAAPRWRRPLPLIAAALVVVVVVVLGVVLFQTGHGNSPGGPSTPPGGDLAAPTLGAYTNQPGATEAAFQQLRSTIPGLRVRRSFAQGMPRSIADTKAANDAAHGYVTFLSVKPSFTDVGSDDDAIASLAASMPAGSYLTAWHEPENDMSAAQYVAMFRDFYRVAKAANPHINIGNVYMTYQWKPGRKVPRPDDWWVGSDSTDFLATDTYMDVYQADSSGNPRPLGKDPAHLRWHRWAATKGKPLLVTELGVGQGFTDAQRAAYFTQSWAWLRANHYSMLLLWNGSGTPPKGESWDFAGGPQAWPLTVRAVQAIAAESSPNTALH